MFNKIIYLIKRIILSTFILYAYNSLAISFNRIVPINISNIIILSIFGLFGMLNLIVFSFFC